MALILTLLADTPSEYSRVVLYIRHPPGAADAVEVELSRRADPDKELYLQWLAHSDVQRLLSPRSAHISAAEQLAKAHGATQTMLVGGDKVVAFFNSGVSPLRLQAAANALPEVIDAVSTSVVARLTNKTFFNATNRRPPCGSRAAACRGSVGDVGNSTPADPQTCLTAMLGVTPTCIRAAYGLDSTTTAEAIGASVDAQAFIVNQHFLPSDLQKFQRSYSLPVEPVQTFVGPSTGKPGSEASLDSQYILTTGQGVPTTYVFLDDRMDNPFTDWLVWAARTPDAQLPKVHSLSLGAPEGVVGDAVIRRMNTEMAALGLRGVSILFASGDSGWQPMQKFGAASPFVTAVGGVFNGEMRDEPLQADFISTGGFAASPLNKAGAWQAAAIKSFMATSGKRPDRIDPSQRAVPDVSAYDDEIAIVESGEARTISGTSAACPMVAGMLSAINAALAAHGHNTTLGFANPFLYRNADSFLDIVRGSNGGIEAVRGYEPVAGLGTFGPSTFAKLREAALHAATTSRARRRHGLGAQLA